MGSVAGGWAARRAGPADVETLVRLRVEFLTEIGDGAAGAAAAPLRAYFGRALPTGEFVGWVAEAGGEVVGTGGLCFAAKPGTGRNPSGLEGYVLNMYTRPGWRGRGIAGRLLRELLAAAAAHGVGCVRLHATPAGRPLYERLGFRAADTEMVFHPGPEAAVVGPS
jgi:GNAT superfamily N-acetyltransferase